LPLTRSYRRPTPLARRAPQERVSSLVLDPEPEETSGLRIDHTSVPGDGTGVDPTATAIVFIGSHFIDSSKKSVAGG